MSKLKLNLGCGMTVVEGWINVDYSLGARLTQLPVLGWLAKKLGLFNVQWDSRIKLHDLRKTLPWQDASVDVVYSSHTLEHMSREDGRSLLIECLRVLKPGGLLRIVVPDLADHVIKIPIRRPQARGFCRRSGCAIWRGGEDGIKEAICSVHRVSPPLHVRYAGFGANSGWPGFTGRRACWFRQ